jgi:hypothetical protein
VLKASQSLLITSTEKELKSEAEGKIAYSARGKERGVPAREGGDRRDTLAEPDSSPSLPGNILSSFFLLFFFFFPSWTAFFVLVTDRYPFFLTRTPTWCTMQKTKETESGRGCKARGKIKHARKTTGPGGWCVARKKKRRGEQDLVSVTARDQEHVRLAGGSWLVLICSERKVLLTGYGWLVCSERKVLLAGG